MSDNDVSFTFVGSIVCTISWVSVPAPTTGMDAVRSTVEPGATVAEEATIDTESTARAGPAGSKEKTAATTTTDAPNRRARDISPR